MAELVQVDAESVRWLVTYALDMLARQCGDEELRGCCHHHCGPCHALMRLMLDGQIDELVIADPDGHSWWNTELQQVDRLWLGSALTALCGQPGGCDGCADCDHDQIAQASIEPVRREDVESVLRMVDARPPDEDFRRGPGYPWPLWLPAEAEDP